jgi:thiamine kinase-like enzyme
MALSKILFMAIAELQEFARVPLASDVLGPKARNLPELLQLQNSPDMQQLFVLHNDIKLDNLLWSAQDRRIKLCAHSSSFRIFFLHSHCRGLQVISAD